MDSKHFKPTPKLSFIPKKGYLLFEKATINALQQLNKLESGVIYFPHDNTKPYLVNIVKEKKAKFDWELLPHPPYSPCLAPSD